MEPFGGHLTIYADVPHKFHRNAGWRVPQGLKWRGGTEKNSVSPELKQAVCHLLLWHQHPHILLDPPPPPCTVHPPLPILLSPPLIFWTARGRDTGCCAGNRTNGGGGGRRSGMKGGGQCTRKKEHAGFVLILGFLFLTAEWLFTLHHSDLICAVFIVMVFFMVAGDNV